MGYRLKFFSKNGPEVQATLRVLFCMLSIYWAVSSMNAITSEFMRQPE